MDDIDSNNKCREESEFEPNNYLDGDYTMKCIIIGESGVGKTSLMNRFVDNVYTAKFVSTVGVEFGTKVIQLNGKHIRIQIWDTSGQERFHSIVSCYYRGATGAIIVFDITNHESFDKVPQWVDQLEQFGDENTVRLLVGTKCDLTDSREVDYKIAKAYADRLGMHYTESSAKENTNVEPAFVDLAVRVKDHILEHLEHLSSIKLHDKSAKGKRKCCC